jgi:hypothetical protein
MESDIIKNISPNEVIEIFEKSENVNIRLYEPTHQGYIDPSDFDKSTEYSIRIRHGENEDPMELLNNEIKNLNKRK